MKPLTVPGTLDALGAIANYTIAATQKAGLEKETAYNLRLAVDEIVTNIITHGYISTNCTGEVYIQAILDEDTLTIQIEDTAIAYDPTRKPAPRDLTLPLEQRQVGGLGVFLAIQGVDRFVYERANGRNRNRLIVKRRKCDGEMG
ncbi:ATP-binding protein [Lusitaniella coriacea]|uniref:ATP-binding protein n=1 Tax=Lusitaniella coriacea TaxID=1983105 RepID=UPI003CE7099A